MLHKADNSAIIFVIAALGLFFIGGLLTTVVPPLIDQSWAKPFENNDPAKGPTGKLEKLTDLQQKGRDIYVREGCWYCHTQQTRTLQADTVRSGWRGVESPISTPDEFVQELMPALNHWFNHQTHHRGQAHMILTGLGQEAPELDLLFYQREVIAGRA